MPQNSIIIFICEHGAAKSIISAAYFNEIAHKRGMPHRAIARGTVPDLELSQIALAGLAEDGLAPTEPAPQKLTLQEFKTVHRMITFCELPVEYLRKNNIEYWKDVPPVSEDYALARDVIIANIKLLLINL